MMEKGISLIGLVVLMGIAWLFSNNKKQIDLRVVLGGLGLQFVLAIIILKTDMGRGFFTMANDGISAVISLSDAGAEFVFGKQFTEHFFAFKVLPTIIFVSSLSYVMFYLGVLQKIVEALAWVMKKIMNISGAEALVTAANVFVGQTEAPLLVKPYIKTMTKSEITTMMVGGMATVAGGVLAAYVGFGISAGHLLAASIMSAPASIVIAKLMVPEMETSPTMGTVKLNVVSDEVNIFEAACKGATEGLKLSLNVGAMLIAFIGLVAFANLILQQLGGWIGFQTTLEEIVGYIFRPLAFIIGVPWSESAIVGQFLGTKIIVNEFLAYFQLAEYLKPESAIKLSERSIIISTYALCGFGNFTSIAIQIGGIGALSPERRQDFALFGFRAMIGGTLAAMMTACIAGVLI